MKNSSSQALRILGHINLNTIMFHLKNGPKAEIGALAQTRVEAKIDVQQIIGCPVCKFLDCVGQMIVIFGDIQRIIELVQKESNALYFGCRDRMKKVERLQTLLRLDNFCKRQWSRV